MYRTRNIIAKATSGEMVAFITQDDERALVSYDPIDCVMVVSTRAQGSVMGGRVNAYDFLEDTQATKCRQHIQDLIG